VASNLLYESAESQLKIVLRRISAIKIYRDEKLICAFIVNKTGKHQ